MHTKQDGLRDAQEAETGLRNFTKKKKKETGVKEQGVSLLD